MVVLQQNCDPNLPVWICVVGNVCGYTSNAIWFLVLLPQLVKNHRRASTVGLSFLWASCNFCASLINNFFIQDIDVPLFTRISGWYMPILEALMLLQFLVYSKVSYRRKMVLSAVSLVVYAIIITLELTHAFGPETSSKMVWVSIVLWSVQTYFQVVLNMKRRSVDGQSYISLWLAFVGKTTDVVMQFSLIMPSQYLYMTYYSSSLAYINFAQLLLFTQRRWYTLPVEVFLMLILCAFAALLILRTSIVSIVCAFSIIIAMALAHYVIRRQKPPHSLAPAEDGDMAKSISSSDAV
ncbi:hypothetical protein BGZ73_006263 [Actinomortierella ambigua]|nr:hypothetical protein BGZ73_006263 [Actinomortierella ambigua]